MGKQNNQQSSGPPFNLVSAKQKASLSPAQTEVSGDHCAVWRELRVLYLGKGRGEEGRGGAEPGIAQERQVARHAWASLFELPLLATHRAVLLHLLCVQPLEDAVHMEAVGALSPHEGAVITRHLTCKERLVLGKEPDKTYRTCDKPGRHLWDISQQL